MLPSHEMEKLAQFYTNQISQHGVYSLQILGHLKG